MTRLISLAAYMVRLEDGCEKGHRAGTWHLHEDAVIETGRLLAELVKDGRAEAEAALRARLVAEVGKLDNEVCPRWHEHTDKAQQWVGVSRAAVLRAIKGESD